MVQVRVTFLLHNMAISSSCNVAISGSCTFQVLIGPRVGSPVVPHVSFLLAHMSCCGWVTCHFFIGPYVIFWLVHVAVSYSTTRHGAVRLCFVFLFGHMAWRLPSMCQIFNRPRVMPTYFTCHALVHPCVAFLFDHVACPGSTTWSTINSS
jgi:hypothetical protein